MGFGVPNMALEFAVRDGLKKVFDFEAVAGDLEFNAAVWQVADPSDDLIATGQRFDGETKSNALDASLIEHLPADHGGMFAQAFGKSQRVLVVNRGSWVRIKPSC
jgi:hypothetical protein